MVFVGPSGCGKTTLLRSIAGLEDVSAGKNMTVAENIGFALKFTRLDKADAHKAVMPLSNLDAALRVQMRMELARLHRELGTTMVYVTHDQVEAMTLGTRIAVFNESSHCHLFDAEGRAVNAR